MFCVDIDQTISTGYKGKSLKESITYYQKRGISLPDTVNCYADIFGLPKVVRLHEVLPGADAGVQRLARVNDVGYFTVRKSEHQQAELEKNTYLWLRDHQFPAPENVTFCVSMVQKLLKINDVPSVDPFFLIDDNWQKALMALQFIEEKSPPVATSIRDKLTIVAFGATTSVVPSNAPVRLVPLPDWAHLEEALCHLLPHQHTVSRL